MVKQFQEITPYRFQASTDGVPIVFNLQLALLPNNEALEQLRGVAETTGVFEHVAVLSDVHPKVGRKCPTGVAVAADRFFPQLMDTAPNCGMRIFTVSRKSAEIDASQIDRVFEKLVKEVPTQSVIGTPIDAKIVLDICRYGSSGLIRNMESKFPFLPGEEEFTFQGGNEFGKIIPDKRSILASIPKLFLKMAQYRLGILGMAGNHFLDLMKVTEITHPEKAKMLGVEEDQLIFFMHTGSGILGQYSSYFYTPKVEEHLLTKLLVTAGRLSMHSDLLKPSEMKSLRQESKSFRYKKELFSIDPGSPRGQAYYLAHRAAGNFGYANRTILSAKIKKVLEEEWGSDVKCQLIYDMGHIGVRQEEHYGKQVWVHRNGVSRAFGPSRMKKHSVFSQTGEPCFFAGSMTTPSYLACATDQNEATFFSASHGAGRKKEIPKGFDKEELFKKVSQDGVRLYNAKSKGVVKQYSDYYKDIDEAMKGIINNKIATPVAKLEPVAVIMA